MSADAWGLLDALRPRALLLAPLALLGIVLITRAARGRRDAARLPRGRRIVATAARVIAVLAAVAALAGVGLVQRDDSLSVLFCLDRSSSMARARQEWALDWIREAARELSPEDRAGLLVFGRDASLETPLQKSPDILEPRTVLDAEHTHIAGALRLAQACFPASSRRAIVLLSDGQENLGDSLEEAAIAASAGIPVITVHCAPKPAPGEVLIDDIAAPERVPQGRPFRLRVTLRANAPQVARLTVQRGAMATTRELKLQAGRQVIELPQRLDEADLHLFKVSIDAPQDDNPQNNVAYALTEVTGQPRILLLDRDPEALRPLVQALEESGFEVELGGPSLMPVSRSELARADAILISDIPATVWSPDQLRALEAYVRDLGGGLAMFGGQESFGLGGYFRTAVERALPVDCNIQNKDDVPTLSLVFCLDRSGSMATSAGGVSSLELAKEGVRRTLELIYPRDQVGILGFDSGAEWALPLQAEVSKSEAERALAELSPGGGTGIFAAVEAGVGALVVADTELKHLVLLTDGRSQDSGDYEAVLADARRAGVTLSTIAIGDAADASLLGFIARVGEGRFFQARNPTELPLIFTKDALTASRSLLVEKSYRPVRSLPLPELGDGPLPPLHGLVLSTVKDGAEQLLSSTPGKEGQTDGPVLARWRFGLGKSLAFTSSVNESWGKDWRRWPGFAEFWVRQFSWLTRDGRGDGADLRVRFERGEGRIEVSLREATTSGELPQLRARIIPPSGAPDIPPVRLEPVAPGRYQGRFEAPRTGVYLVTAGLIEAQGERALATRGAVLPYPREHRELKSEPETLARIAAITGGRALELDARPPADLFDLDIPAKASFQEAWARLILIAALALLLDITARRLDLAGLLSNLGEARRPSSDGAVLETLIDRKAEIGTKLRRARKAPAESPGMRLAGGATAGGATAGGATGVTPPQTPPPPPPAPAQPPPPAPARPTPPQRPAAPSGDITGALLAAKRRARSRKPKDDADGSARGS